MNIASRVIVFNDSNTIEPTSHCSDIDLCVRQFCSSSIYFSISLMN